MIEDLDITKVRQSINEFAFDLEETIRLHPEFLLENGVLKKEVTKAFVDKMNEVKHIINTSSEEQFLDQNLLFLAIRLLELRKKIKEIKYSNMCQNGYIIKWAKQD